MLTPREAESDFNNDQLTAIRAYFTRRLRRGDRSIDAHFQYRPFDQEPPTPAAELALLPLCDKCHTCGMTLEMRPGKIACRATLCRSNVSETMMWDYDVNDIAHPYHGPCRSRHPVRHE